eukprot:scaffold181062_cov45-Prasinocladus_malaysianus.AAC.1
MSGAKSHQVRIALWFAANIVSPLFLSWLMIIYPMHVVSNEAMRISHNVKLKMWDLLQRLGSVFWRTIR